MRIFDYFRKKKRKKKRFPSLEEVHEIIAREGLARDISPGSQWPSIKAHTLVGNSSLALYYHEYGSRSKNQVTLDIPGIERREGILVTFVQGRIITLVIGGGVVEPSSLAENNETLLHDILAKAREAARADKASP